MWIISWNIQKIDSDKARSFSREIGGVVNGLFGDEPFILFVLENKTSADSVMGAIGTGIKASDLIMKVVETGGSPTLRENIIVIAGNGATFDEPVQFTDWHTPYNERCAVLHLQEQQAVQTKVDQLRVNRPARQATENARTRREQTAAIDTYRPAKTLRNPIALTVRFENRSAKILALHAPGPSDGQDNTERTATIFANAVFATAEGADLVIGDFNLRSGGDAFPGFVDQAMLLGATTKGAEDGRHVSSRLDRVYVRRGFPVTSMLASDSDDKLLTDHHCLAVRVDDRPQRLVTDYFQYVPSPLRRQRIGDIGRRLADRCRNHTAGIDGDTARAKRRTDAEDLRKQKRNQTTSANRHQADSDI